MSKDHTLSVTAIKNGSVIDHIPAGHSPHIIRLLGLSHANKQVTAGLNLPSKQQQRKDIIKIEDHYLSEQETKQVAVFAPHATVNIIKDYNIIEKIKLSVPETISNIFACPNSHCICNTERVNTFFYVSQRQHDVLLRCKYCEGIFPQTLMQEQSPC